MKNRDGSEGHGGGEHGRPENKSPHPSHERALAISSAVVAICFLAHILVLLLVDPLKVLHLSKLNAYAISSIPLAMGVVFFFDAITNFMRIESRSAGHLGFFLLAILFGSFSIHGLLGFLIYLVRHPPAF